MIAEIVFDPQKQLTQMIWIWVGLCAFFVWLQARRAYGGGRFHFYLYPAVLRDPPVWGDHPFDPRICLKRS